MIQMDRYTHRERQREQENEILCWRYRANDKTHCRMN